MKIGIMSDIHANLSALLVVLLKFREEGVDKIINLGDSVGYYNKPREVLALLRELRNQKKLIQIMGNHDVAVSGFIFHDMFSPDFIANIGASLIKSTNYNAQESWSWTISNINQELCAVILDETSKTVEFEGARIHLVHGAPSQMKGDLKDEVGFYLTKQMVQKYQNELHAFFDMNNVDILLTGHTHHQMHLRIGKTHLINPGSVGQPRDGDERTAFAIIEVSNKELQSVRFFRENYVMEDRIEARFSYEDSDGSLFDILL